MQVVGSTVVVTAGVVEQLDLRWKLSKPTRAVAVVVPVPSAAEIQGADAGAARDAGNATAPQRTSFLLQPWILPGDGARDAVAARDALEAPTQQVRVAVPLPGGVLGARGPQVVAVTADTTMRAADADNVAPVVSGVDRAADGRWQTVLLVAARVAPVVRPRR